MTQSSTWVQTGLAHPVTAAWADANRTRLTNISADSRFELTPHPGASPLASYADGVPVAVSSEVGAGRAVLFGTSPVPASTQRVLHPFFPILVGGLEDYLAVEPSATPALRPGEAFSASVPPTALMYIALQSANAYTHISDDGKVRVTRGARSLPRAASPWRAHGARAPPSRALRLLASAMWPCG